MNYFNLTQISTLCNKDQYESDIIVEPQNKPSVEKFGTFLGVYTPSVLTILGLVM